LILEGSDGAEAALAVQPKDYWQFDYNTKGTAVSTVIRANGGNPGQSNLGLPLFAGYFTVFDNTGPNGAVKFAPRAEPAAPPVA